VNGLRGGTSILAFSKSQTDAMDVFPAMLKLEICMRKDYNMRPFAYNAEHYEHEYEKAKLDVHIRNCETSCLTSWRLPFSNAFGKSTGGTEETKGLATVKPGLAFGKGKIMSSFQKGSSSDPSSAICLICARRGHLFSDCTHTVFEDGLAVFSCARDGLLISIRGNIQFC
jgi:hypothetical protein